MCIACPLAATIGGFVGSTFFGVNPPNTTKGKRISLALSISLTVITVLALKIFFNISLCKGSEYTFKNISTLMLKGLSIGTLYSIGVNYLLDRFVYHEEVKKKLPDELPDELSECCCKKENNE